MSHCTLLDSDAINKVFVFIVLWMQHKTLEKHFVDKLSATVDSHACKMYVLKAIA
jgi:hypothetical protein